MLNMIEEDTKSPGQGIKLLVALNRLGRRIGIEHVDLEPHARAIRARLATVMIKFSKQAREPSIEALAALEIAAMNAPSTGYAYAWAHFRMMVGVSCRLTTRNTREKQA